ncbi:MAG: hypothetical protein Q9220_005589 [cf. Caloplaca sp. 1 TL-2023]
MARPKKGEEQSKDSASLQISIEDFVRTRDSVVTGLATLQSAVQDLSRAYIAHTNTVIGKGTGTSLELLSFANPLGGENGLFSGRVPTPAPAPEQGEVKKRKRAPHDKNAPKRPVTPYFLYMQYAREGIAREMGPSAPAKQVADEGTRRWNTMAREEKDHWADLYACNYAAYKKKVEAYKAGLPIPEFTKDEARQLYNEQRNAGAVPEPPPDALSDRESKMGSDEEEEEEEEEEEAEEAESEAAASSASSDEDEDESPEPPKIVSPPKSPQPRKRGKVIKEKPAKKASPIKEPPPVEKERKSLDAERTKKAPKKREVKTADEVIETKKDTLADRSRKTADLKPKRKKRKSEAADS